MLRISREGVDSRDITDYPMESRFIKLPIEAYLKMLPARDPITNAISTAWDQTNGPQIALINAVNDPRFRFVVAALSRRLGKTYISNIIAQMVLLVPGYNVLIMSPNFNLSSISFDLQRNLVKTFDLEVERDNVKDKILELSNGSSIRMGSVKTVDSNVGRSYNLIIFDEAAIDKDGEAAFEIQLRPTLDRPGSKAIFISTPRGKNNWFSTFFNRGFSEDYPEWISIHADWTENPRMSVKDVDEAKRSMSKAGFEQEYMASFNSYEGQIFEIDDNHIVDYERADGDEVIAGLDPGYKDPTAFIVIVWRPTDDTYWIVDEFIESEMKTPQLAEVFREKIEKWGIADIFIDSAAAMLAADLAYVHNISTIKAKKDVLPGIAFLQALVQQRRLFIDPRCTETLAAFDQYKWDDKEGLQRERPEHTYSHIPDAVRYAVYTFTV